MVVGARPRGIDSKGRAPLPEVGGITHITSKKTGSHHRKYHIRAITRQHCATADIMMMTSRARGSINHQRGEPSSPACVAFSNAPPSPLSDHVASAFRRRTLRREAGMLVERRQIYVGRQTHEVSAGLGGVHERCPLALRIAGAPPTSLTADATIRRVFAGGLTTWA